MPQKSYPFLMIWIKVVRRTDVQGRTIMETVAGKPTRERAVGQLPPYGPFLPLGSSNSMAMGTTLSVMALAVDRVVRAIQTPLKPSALEG